MKEKIFGLIGNPISHSSSPALFNAAYAGKYRYDLIEGDFEDAMRIFRESYSAINVTAPYKELAFKASDIYDDTVRRIGAANILINNEDGSITAHNSDYHGVKMILKDHFEIEDGLKERIKALVIGAGGAGKAAACAALDLGMDVTMTNRSEKKCMDFISRDGNENIRFAQPSDIQGLIEANQLIIYAIPTVLDNLQTVSKRAFRGKSILEANYRFPTFTREYNGMSITKGRLAFRKDSVAIPQRCYYLSGEIWLISQAITGYTAMTGETPDEAAMLTAI